MQLAVHLRRSDLATSRKFCFTANRWTADEYGASAGKFTPVGATAIIKPFRSGIHA